MGSHTTTVDIHEAMQILFCLASFLVVGRPQALTFLDSSPDTEQGQRQVTGQDLAWKLQQIRFLVGQSTSFSLAGICLGSHLLLTAGVTVPAMAQVLPGPSWVGGSLLSALQKEVGKTLHIGKRGCPS